jgi:hypothetical protein
MTIISEHQFGNDAELMLISTVENVIFGEMIFGKNMTELRAYARELGMRRYSKMRKSMLQHAILDVLVKCALETVHVNMTWTEVQDYMKDFSVAYSM